MSNKAIIITGGNSGLGFQCAKNIALVDKEATIILACRNIQKAESAIQELANETGNKNISVRSLDLASLDSVRSFAKNIKAENLPPLYALVCNAGLNPTTLTYTKEGFETTFGVNHLGHYLLANLLLDTIEDNGKIIFVSSDTHNPPKIFPFPAPVFENAERLAHPQEQDNAMLRYPTSKLCNLMTAYAMSEKARKETEKVVNINAFNPGLMVSTNLNGGSSHVQNAIMIIFGKVLGRLGSAEGSGKALAEMVTSLKYDNVTGKYIDRGVDTKSSTASYDKIAIEKLWKESAELVHLQKNETILSFE
ncbi:MULTISPECIES: SDR family NAD(P)-dependent oxidoreductase [unclassified Lactococcus]|uniref:SDR family NAD(P)-dependent oxidoreductase n=1 Tax=unclassified Lactococcus TaxID=2643510 RepID=UPI0011C8558B|nr:MULTISPECIES: SDR family NAD(P)-dependent oxidoreductase [unclassified Lactococcus]MQW23786.1 SDR family NAD(P)-dependent oxidoreductase [Lactococcus sp. dk101]TXK37421.1 SDR family NAD(P)-dependent oxidoreductase [Lactococcus sp. dk310]TXK48764.1 SDR family NAD(P)-dependent oxidoreductase [Lactococcus sp. dk322]